MTKKNNIKFFSGSPDSELFALYEESFNNLITKINKGDNVEGEVVSITKDIALIDFNYRQMGMVDIEKEKTLIELNGKYTFCIKDIKGEDIYLSCDEYEKNKIYDALIDDVKYNTDAKTKPEDINFYEGKVEEIYNKAGFIVNISGIKCFMPGSLADINKMFNFEELLNKKIKVASVNIDKGNIVVSRKLYLQSLVPNEIDKLEMSTKIYEGTVTGTNAYGVYVKFNKLLTGMIHYSELSGDDEDRFNNRRISDGSRIKFRVKNINKGNKIVLTQKEEDVWMTNIKKLSVGDVVKVNVIRYVSKGYLVNFNSILRGVVKTKNTYKNKDNFDAKIISIDKKSKRIYLEE